MKMLPKQPTCGMRLLPSHGNHRVTRMTTRNLDRLFRPDSVVLIGASEKPGSVGAVLARNLCNGGFVGRVMMVNPRRKTVGGRPCFSDVASLPETPDLAVIATPPDTVPGLISDLAARGTRAAVVITAGFSETGQSRGQSLQQAMLHAARPELLRIIGPNCLGILLPGIGLNASFAHIQPLRGQLAFVAQSGAVLTSVLDWATPRGIGFSHIVALGDMADVDFGDMLDYLVRDNATRAILLYVEMITSPRKFMSAARAAARMKPVIVVKAGRHDESARAAASHTGALAGTDLVYDAAFRRAGMLRVYELADLFTAAETLSRHTPVGGDRLAIITNGGGIGVMATDRLIDEGGRLATLSPATLAKLEQALPPTWSHGNPIDIIGDADGPRYAAALEAVLDDPGSDAILVLNCPTAVSSSAAAARAIATVKEHHSERPILTSWVGELTATEAREILRHSNMPAYDTPETAVRAFMQMVTYGRNQRALMQVPDSRNAEVSVNRATVRGLIGAAMGEGKAWLALPDALKCLSAYGIQTVPTRFAETASAVASAAASLKPPFALKIISPDIVHKSEVGGVILDLPTREAACEAAKVLVAHIAQACPEARIEGVAVQSMIRRTHGYELLLGIADDRQFGPVVLFGQGGTSTEIVADRAIALPPLNESLAVDLINRTRISRLLRGYRDRPAANMNAVTFVLMQISQLAIDHPEIAELDINPLLADETGVMALDARIRLAKPALPGDARFAIRAYPRELETVTLLWDGRTANVRPLRPDDAAALRRMFERTASGELYFKFLQAFQESSQALAARLTQIDYDREMAFGIFVPQANENKNRSIGPVGEVIGVVHLAMSPDHDTGELAVIVRSDMKGKGLGYFLLQHISSYAEAQGVSELHGQVHQQDTAMIKMSGELGFAINQSRGDDPFVRVSRSLRPH